MQLNPDEITELVGPWNRCKDAHIYDSGTPKRSTLTGNRGIRPNSHGLCPDETVAILMAKITNRPIFDVVAEMYGKK